MVLPKGTMGFELTGLHGPSFDGRVGLAIPGVSGAVWTLPPPLVWPPGQIRAAHTCQQKHVAPQLLCPTGCRDSGALKQHPQRDSGTSSMATEGPHLCPGVCWTRIDQGQQLLTADLLPWAPARAYRGELCEGRSGYTWGHLRAEEGHEVVGTWPFASGSLSLPLTAPWETPQAHGCL
ncbi:hypothetical protein TREES_T100000672 [Tupaia chinensis]|uniref:Uncharacterized protein n=1 Tax=Tupaia chinensis TaxID=246437 RepID=L9KP02_TUPCH|nr:hypothetical protein TREES_T100000672 [Tupaia chinensis]